MDSNEFLERVTAILAEYLNQRVSGKDNWMVVAHHGRRVEGYVEMILKGHPDLNLKLQLTVRTAAMLHDIGSLDGKEGHALRGAMVADRLLDDAGLFADGLVSRGDLQYLIGHHSRNIDCEITPLLAILRDADRLDQIGAMSILWHASQHRYESPDFYYSLHEVICRQELDFCDQVIGKMYTQRGRDILLSKRAFIETFCCQLEMEMFS